MQVNQGLYVNEISDFAIAKVLVWDRGLSQKEMHEASGYLLKMYHHSRNQNDDDLQIVNTELVRKKMDTVSMRGRPTTNNIPQ